MPTPPPDAPRRDAAALPPGGGDAGPPGRGLVDFRALAGRLRLATGVLGALALAACVADGLLNGLTFGLMARWAAAFVGALVVVGAVLVALSAVGGVRTAHDRGERLRSDGTGLVPPRRQDGDPDRRP